MVQGGMRLLRLTLDARPLVAVHPSRHVAQEVAAMVGAVWAERCAR